MGSLSRTAPNLITVVVAVHVGTNVHLVDGDVVCLDRVGQHDTRRINNGARAAATDVEEVRTRCP